ncbi:TRF-like 2 [Actinidia rufa]|uniref:TRF-like 2 n=1 Tax=Actinidia rufa TaxID=165716 RepID=A0A7J0H4K1_9ERIC|nr:TRF-like 2 [Actinidia rufa]
MVLQNRLGYGFNGYQVPPTPRAARSARRRGSIRKRVDDNQICAFDLLATVAGKLLLEGQGSASSSNIQNGKELCTIVEDSIKKEQQGADKASKIEICDQGSCGIHHISKEFSHAHIDYCSGLASVITSSDGSDTVDSADKLVDGKSMNQPGNFASKVEVASSRCESFDGTIENENKEQIKMELPTTGNASNSTKADMCSLDDPAVRFRKSPALVSLDNSVTLPLGTDHVHSGSFPACWDDVNLVIRDDDENSSGCTLPSTMKKAFRPSPRIGDRRIRKLLASKYWKVTPKLKDGENFNADSETKPVYHNRKTCYKRQRSQRDYPIKKRILYDRVSVSNFDGGVSHEDISSSPRKGSSFGASGSAAMVHGAFGNSAGYSKPTHTLPVPRFPCEASYQLNKRDLLSVLLALEVVGEEVALVPVAADLLQQPKKEKEWDLRNFHFTTGKQGVIGCKGRPHPNCLVMLAHRGRCDRVTERSKNTSSGMYVLIPHNGVL